MTSLNQLRARFARDEGLPFADVLTEASIRDVLHEHGVKYRNRVFDPVTTIWGFLSQVLSDDHSCSGAVSRIIAHRAANGLGACSPNTTSYCNARGRVVTGVLRTLARRTAQELQAAAAEDWKWNARHVFIADGSHVSMPDTPENQASYPQPPTQQPGLGFPLARVAVLLSLATGACHDLAIAPYAGKGTGETTLLRQMYGALKPGLQAGRAAKRGGRAALRLAVKRRIRGGQPRSELPTQKPATGSSTGRSQALALGHRCAGRATACLLRRTRRF
jgi:hypothetical protein